LTNFSKNQFIQIFVQGETGSGAEKLIDQFVSFSKSMSVRLAVNLSALSPEMLAGDSRA